MCRPSRTALIRRPAFTLVEMIVVIAIVLLLSTLAVALVPRMAERQKTQRGADQLQGWFGIARQWARRARVPTGIRLLPGRLLPNPATPNVNYVTELQYIQQPPDFIVSSGPNVRGVTVAGNKVSLVGSIPGDFSGGLGPKNLWPVQQGDYFEANGGGLMHRIVSVDDPTSLTLESSVVYPITNTKQYRIVRSARPLPGEATLQIPQDVAIDLNLDPQTGRGRSLPIPPMDPSNPQPIDIVFSPSGAVMVSGANDKVILWVRDVTQDTNTPGDQILITIYVRTGLIAAFEVAPLPDYYFFTRDGRSGGL